MREVESAVGFMRVREFRGKRTSGDLKSLELRARRGSRVFMLTKRRNSLDCDIRPRPGICRAMFNWETRVGKVNAISKSLN